MRIVSNEQFHVQWDEKQDVIEIRPKNIAYLGQISLILKTLEAQDLRDLLDAILKLPERYRESR